MTTPVVVVGHQNPDNDSICAAVGYAYLKNAIEKRACERDPQRKRFEYIPARLGPMPPESAWVLERCGYEIPQLISHVHARVLDVMTPNPYSISKEATLLDAGRMLRKHNVRALVVTDAQGKYQGLITTRMIAERYIAATDLLDEGQDASNQDAANMAAVAADLIASLGQKVEEITEKDVLILDKEGLLKEAVEDLMATTLREAVVVDDDDRCVGIVTRTDVATKPKRKVILVDHNETRQSVNGIEEAEVVEIIDHHRIGDVSTMNPIKFSNMPVGSTATIVALEFLENHVYIPEMLAAVLLSAIMTDTLMLKSPTTTDIDREQASFLASLAALDATEFGTQVFKCRVGEDKDLPVERIVGADAKEFQLGDSVALIAQHETVGLDGVLEREDEIREYMQQLKESKDYEFVLLMITDITAEGSQFLCEGNRRVVNRVFNINCTGSGGTWMPGILSRKKQVAAKILGA